MADDRIDFSIWRAAFIAALAGDIDAEVPCAGCTACCRSRQFVHIGADEVDTLAHIPSSLLVPAPGATGGQMVMGYDVEGRCPMLGPAGCRIYEHRPRTCRAYDCRVFAATGMTPEQPLVAARVRDWSFTDTPGRRAAADTARRLRADGSGPIEAAVRAVQASPPTSR